MITLTPIITNIGCPAFADIQLASIELKIYDYWSNSSRHDDDIGRNNKFPFYFIIIVY